MCLKVLKCSFPEPDSLHLIYERGRGGYLHLQMKHEEERHSAMDDPGERAEIEERALDGRRSGLYSAA